MPFLLTPSHTCHTLDIIPPISLATVALYLCLTALGKHEMLLWSPLSFVQHYLSLGIIVSFIIGSPVTLLGTTITLLVVLKDNIYV